MTREHKIDIAVGISSIALLAAMVFILSGCATKGFQYVDSGIVTPWQLRAAAATARSEANALEQIADINEGFMQRVIQSTSEAVNSIGGAGVPIAALIGAAGGLFIPSPGSKKRLEAKTEDKP